MSNQGNNRRNHPHVGGPFGAMIRGGEKPQDFKGTLRKLLQRLAKFTWAFILAFILSIAGNIFSIVGPKILGSATTTLFNGFTAKSAGIGFIDFPTIGKIILLLLALYLTAAFFSFIQGFIMTKVANTISYSFRQEMSKKISRLPIKYFDSTPNGEILSRITNDVDTLTQSLTQNLNQLIASLVTLVGVLVMMFSISVPMTLVTLVIVPLSLILVLIVVKFSQKQFRIQQSLLGKVNAHIEEQFSGHIIIKAFNGERKSLATFDHYNDQLYHSNWKSQFLSGLIHPIMMLIGNIGYVAVCVLGGNLAYRKLIAVGDIQAFIQYVRSFQQPLTQTAQISNQLQSMVAAAERVFAFLAEPEESEDSGQALCPDDIRGNVTFANVKFAYDADKAVIHNFTAKISAGQRVAIVGPTGAGKTTMVKLLLRFYDVSQGTILIDGYNIKDFRRHDLRSLFGMVLQDTWLFNASIADNIRYNKLTATQTDILAASQAAHADNFIKTLPQAYDFQLNEEANNISAGQKQLLTIARAFLADPKILIFDEATSSVDTRTEILIQSAMDRLMKGRTCFIIAHRLSTIRNADVILVMNEGDIVEQGTHDQLMKLKGFYAKLYNSQFAQN